ncbi:hypothetical protein LguiB_025928 [Lonicera macranthoides]
MAFITHSEVDHNEQVFQHNSENSKSEVEDKDGFTKVYSKRTKKNWENLYKEKLTQLHLDQDKCRLLNQLASTSWSEIAQVS